MIAQNNMSATFASRIEEELARKGTLVSIKEEERVKANDRFNALTITPLGASIGFSISLDQMIEAYARGDALDLIEKGLAATSVDVPTEYQDAKARLVLQVVGQAGNEAFLAGVPHETVEDLAVIYRVVLDEGPNGAASYVVNDGILKAWGITPAQLHKDALAAAQASRPITITGIMERLMTEMGASSPEELGFPPTDGPEQMYVASCGRVHGAAVIAYPGFFEAAEKKLGGSSFYLLPSSIHEVLLVPDQGCGTPEEFATMVREVNATQVAPEERLSDSVYYYNAEDGSFKKVA